MHKKLAAEYGAASLVQVSAQAEKMLRTDQDALVAQGQMLKSAPGSSAKQAKEEQLLQAAEKIDVAQHALTEQAGEAVKYAQEASSALTGEPVDSLSVCLMDWCPRCDEAATATSSTAEAEYNSWMATTAPSSG